MSTMEEKHPVSADDVGGIDQWPVKAGIQYDEEGPSLLCDGWAPGYGGHLSPCYSEIHGNSLAELRADLEGHLRYTQHYRSPFEIPPFSPVSRKQQ